MRTIIAALLVLAMCNPLASARKWTDSTGKYRTEAQFVEFKDGKVHLRMADGKVIAVPIEKLSSADAEYARAQHASNSARAAGQAALIIEKATTTTQPQSIIHSITMNRFDEAEPTKVKAGHMFLMITFSLAVTEGEIEVDYLKELVWSHPKQKDTVRGYGKMSGSDEWNAFCSGKTFREGKYTFEMLYIVPTDQVDGSAITFLGNGYPLDGRSAKRDMVAGSPDKTNPLYPDEGRQYKRDGQASAPETSSRRCPRCGAPLYWYQESSRSGKTIWSGMRCIRGHWFRGEGFILKEDMRRDRWLEEMGFANEPWTQGAQPQQSWSDERLDKTKKKADTLQGILDAHKKGRSGLSDLERGAHNRD